MKIVVRILKYNVKLFNVYMSFYFIPRTKLQEFWH